MVKAVTFVDSSDLWEWSRAAGRCGALNGVLLADVLGSCLRAAACQRGRCRGRPPSFITVGWGVWSLVSRRGGRCLEVRSFSLLTLGLHVRSTNAVFTVYLQYTSCLKNKKKESSDPSHGLHRSLVPLPLSLRLNSKLYTLPAAWAAAWTAPWAPCRPHFNIVI